MKYKLLQKTITKKKRKKKKRKKKKNPNNSMTNTLKTKTPAVLKTSHGVNTHNLQMNISLSPPPSSLSPYISISTGCLQKSTYRYNICIYIIIITIIAFKGAIRDFLQSPHSAANCLQHVRSSGSGAIVCKSRATHRALTMCNMSCSMPLCTKGQPSY